MRPILTLFTLFIFCFCAKGNAQIKASPDTIAKNDSLPLKESRQEKEWKSQALAWEKYQDSLRNELLRKKKNKILKESFLQEMYLRNVVTVSNDSLHIVIPFDLHGPDCGAPDCYSTDVSFSFRLRDNLVFPELLSFDEETHGCGIDGTIKLSGTFQLIEATSTQVIYQAKEQQRILVLNSSDHQYATSALYFYEVDLENDIQSIQALLNHYDTEDESNFPFQSTVLQTQDYDFFVQQ